MKDVRAMAEATSKGMADFAANKPEIAQGFGQFAGAVLSDGAVDLKIKELIAVGIAAFSRCEYCIVGHVNNAFKAGCTKEEILEAAGVAIAFGGGPASAYVATTLMDAVNEFEKDYK